MDFQSNTPSCGVTREQEIFWDGYKYWFWIQDSWFADYRPANARGLVQERRRLSKTEAEALLAEVRETKKILTGLRLPFRQAGEVVDVGGHPILATLDRLRVPPQPGTFKRFAEILVRVLPDPEQRSAYILWLACQTASRQTETIPCFLGPCKPGKGLLVKMAAYVIQHSSFYFPVHAPSGRINCRFTEEDLESIVYRVNLTNADVSGPGLGNLVSGEPALFKIGKSKVILKPEFVFLLRCLSSNWIEKEERVSEILGDRLLVFQTADEGVNLTDSSGHRLTSEALDKELTCELPAFLHYLAEVHAAGRLLPLLV